MNFFLERSEIYVIEGYVFSLYLIRRKQMRLVYEKNVTCWGLVRWSRRELYCLFGGYIMPMTVSMYKK